MSEWKTYKSLNHDYLDLFDNQDFNYKKSSLSFNPKNHGADK